MITAAFMASTTKTKILQVLVKTENTINVVVSVYLLPSIWYDEELSTQYGVFCDENWCNIK